MKTKTMQFNVSCVKNCLVENKEVFTVRKYKSYGLVSAVKVEDIGMCRKEFIKIITDKKELLDYVKLSGFESLDDWFNKIRMFISENETMYLYRVIINKKAEDLVIGVSGNRTGFSYEEVAQELDKHKPDKIVSGGAQGVDSFAEIWARKNGVDVQVFKPDYSRPSPERYFERNGKIVDASDFLCCFDKKNGISGTGNTIRQAQKQGKKIIVVGGDDSLKESNYNIWKSTADVICVTTNGIVKRNGELVMGAGMAREAVKRHNNIAECYGDHVKEYGNTPCEFHADGKIIMSLPTKDNWIEAADIDLIVESIERISRLVPQNMTIAIPRVGCGCGGLEWQDVKKRIEPLLDERFTIFSR